MSGFATHLATKIADYIQLRRSLGYAFDVQSATLRAFAQFVAKRRDHGPLTGEVAIAFALSCDVTATIRAKRYAVLVRFADYFAVFDPRTPPLDPHALPRSRSTPPAQILNDAQLARLLLAARSISPPDVLRGEMLYTLLGLLASTGMRSGEARRLDRADVDLTTGVLQIRQTKFRKDRLVPVHPTTRARLRAYALVRDRVVRRVSSPAFFVSTCGSRLSAGNLSTLFRKARRTAGLVIDRPQMLRPHDLRHRFAIARLVQWYRDGVDVQAHLPLLATYLGHVRYSDTAYYITGTPELLGLVAARVFGSGGVR